jgi:hypothetical protein
MADRIFPNKYQESGLDSELVFTGINWDTFGQRLAAMEEGEDKKNDVPVELLKAIDDKYKQVDVDIEANDDGHYAKWASVDEDEESEEDESEEDEDSDVDTDEDDEMTEESEMKKKASKIVFTNPAQLSAEAVEAALASGNTKLANTILTARHERRVRLASKIEEKVAEEVEINEKLAQRKAYRESLVNKVVKAESSKRTKTSSSDDFVKVSNMSNSSKRVFAAKAIAQGFPQEYVEAMLGTTKVADNLSEIKKVLSSDLDSNVKIAAASSMVKTATLSDADYSRLVDYWKNELGYGDQEWIDALFTKKYDK